ncbi:MAG: NAD(P)/FAD-dependent oxidoreductase, partial [Robiginitomaculum sp.]|nr:NAD(P)/FAD-dependent oxidoreductase [Robiginitomaculum sp.]
FAILEGRDKLGGTWDLFKYPGVRSDSDMYTFGYAFKPWTEGKDIASAESILNYLKETSQQYGVAEKIRYGHKVEQVSWDSEQSRWIVDIIRTHTDERFQMSCNFLLSCMGYYNYEKSYVPEFKNFDDYQGEVVHPQFWPDDLNYKDKNVLVIGSGATAITILPSMAEKTAHITMLQRSPTFVFTRPAVDKIAKLLRKILPTRAAFKLTRWKNVVLNIVMFNRARKKPDDVRKFLLDMAKDELKGSDVDADVHFNPSYNPWDQRLCLVPDADLFKVLKDGSASIVTDTIETFTKTGVLLSSGKRIDADIIIPATGLDVQFFGGVKTCVDGREINPGDLVNYKGMMFGGVPNFAAVFGYTNASWTLKADLTSGYVVRLLQFLEKNGYKTAMPILPEKEMVKEPIVGLKSGYLLRKLDALPKQGDHLPWRNPENYMKDYKTIRWGKLDDGVMSFK